MNQKPLPEPDSAEYPAHSGTLVLSITDHMSPARRHAARIAVLVWCFLIEREEPKLARAYRDRWE